jgi:hypothetical protein
MKILHRIAVVGLAMGLPALAWADDSPSLFAPPFQIAQASSTVEQQRAQPAPPIVALEPQKWALAVGGLYTHREGETAGWLPNVEANYAVTDRLQLHAMVPYAYDRLTGGSTNFGVGDIETGVRYRFIDDDPDGWTPAVAVYPLIDLPTGDKNKNLGTGETHAFLPLWFSKRLGPWIPYAGGGYWINPGTFNKNWIFAAAGAVRELSEAWSLTGELFYASASKVGLKDQTGFDVGARYNLTEHHHFVLTVGRGLANADETNQLTTYVAYVITF